MAENPFLSLPKIKNASNSNPFLSLPKSSNQTIYPDMIRELETTMKNQAAGSTQGIKDIGDTGNKAWLNVANMLGLDKNLPVKYDQYKTMTDAEQKSFEASPEGQSMGGKSSRFITQNLPYTVVPGGVQGGILKRMLTGGLSNAGIGAVNDIAEKNSFPINTLLGGSLGVALPPALAAGKLAIKPLEAVYDFVFPKQGIVKQTAKIIGSDAKNAFATKEAGDRLGVHLTPAESSGNPLLAELQGKAGTSEEGAQQLFEFGKAHISQQQGAVRNLINDVSKSPDSAAINIRQSAKNIIRKDEQSLRQKAEPFYRESASDEVSGEQLKELLNNKRFRLSYRKVLNDVDYSDALKREAPRGKKLVDLTESRIDSMISQAQKKSYSQDRIATLLEAKKNLRTDPGNPLVQHVLSKLDKDPVFLAQKMGVNPHRIDFLDQVKKVMDDAYKGTQSFVNPEPYRASLISGTIKNLTKEADQASDLYPMARQIYGTGAKPLRDLKQSPVGQIANLKDSQLKRVSKMIFDPGQTDAKVMVNLRNRIGKESPGAWNQIVRNEMERRLDKTAGTGINFYEKILKGERGFNQFVTAVEHIPGAQKKLIDMRSAFKNIINPTSGRTSARLAKSSLNVPRSSVQAVKDYVSNLMGGRYDKAFVEFITNPKWDHQVKDILNKPANQGYEKVIKYGAALNKIAVGASSISQSD